MGAFIALLVALLTEMYGVPLTIYLFGQLARVPVSAAARHACRRESVERPDRMDWRSAPKPVSPCQLRTDRRRVLADRHLVGSTCRGRSCRPAGTTGPYGRVRHPQYEGVTAGDDLLSAAVAHDPDADHVPDPGGGIRAAGPCEEQKVAARFGNEWTAYAERTMVFVPRFRFRRYLPGMPVGDRASGDVSHVG